VAQELSLGVDVVPGVGKVAADGETQRRGIQLPRGDAGAALGGRARVVYDGKKARTAQRGNLDGDYKSTTHV
jgi:hypothetical protein